MYSLACAQIWLPSNDTSTRCPRPLELAREERGEDAGHQVLTRDVIRDRDGDRRRVTVVDAGAVDEASARLGRQVCPGARRIGAERAERRACCVDEARVARR